MGLWDHIKPAAVAPVPASVEQTPDELRIVWTDGVRTAATFRELRVGCPCAGCVEEWSGKRTVDASAIDANIHVVALQQVGNYALTMTFSDGHTTGIYSWITLRGLGRIVG